MKIWTKHGWNHGRGGDEEGRVVYAVLRDELIKAVPDLCNLTKKGIDILEDNNYHIENQIIRECQRVAAGDV